MAKKNKTTIEDANTEMLLVGCFYINPDLFLDYGDLIKSKYDFYHNTAKFLYNSIYEMYHYYNYTNESIDEVKSGTPPWKPDRGVFRCNGCAGR